MVSPNVILTQDLPDARLARDYQYDVFVSYPHVEGHERWVQKVFIEKLRPYLTNALGRTAKIFSDRSGIESGDEWPEQLKYALAHSRVIVPVWSVEYFNSKWCMAECSVFRHRENKCGFRRSNNAAGLIHPVRLYDGENYPPFAKRVQAGIDCNDYNHLTEEHTRLEVYVKLVEIIRGWAPQLADGVRRAPAWKPTMRSRSWLDDLVGSWVGNPDLEVPNEAFASPKISVRKK